MFLVFLPPLNFRGDRAPYLWWFHKLLSSFGEEAAYICGTEYFRDAQHLATHGHLDTNLESARLHAYRVPDKATLDRILRVDIPVEKWLAFENEFPSNPLAALKHYCLVEDERLCSAIETALDEVISRVGSLEAVLTCINCASLQKICRQRNLPVLHLELGPLRQPHFLSTAYFDFSGVNGKTESARRFAQTKNTSDVQEKKFTTGELRELLMVRRLDAIPPPCIDLGLALQIEDDSNLICYSHGFTTPTLINHARQQVTTGRVSAPVRIRTHPSSLFSIRALSSELTSDSSTNSLAFIMLCRRIETINSGTAAEAALLERAVQIYGDSPLNFCWNSESFAWDMDALTFFFLNYLVPWDLAFQPEYVRWRLHQPTESEVRQRHLGALMQEKNRILELRITELEQAVAARDAQLAQIKNSLLWRALFAIWRPCRYILRSLGIYQRIP